jgi:hypothetical protein
MLAFFKIKGPILMGKVSCPEKKTQLLVVWAFFTSITGTIFKGVGVLLKIMQFSPKTCNQLISGI